MASSIDRVKQSIRERLDELEIERDRLMKAFEALSEGATASVGGRRGRPPGSKSSAGRRAAAGKRAPRGQRREQVIAALQGGEMGPTAIARELGVAPAQISGLLRQLAADGVVAKNASGKWQLTGGSTPQEQPAAAPEAHAGNGDTPPAPADSFQG